MKKTFDGLESLRTLKANDMKRLQTVEEDAFSGTPLLEALYLEDNANLHFIHPKAFGNVRADGFPLRKLHLAGNLLMYLPEDLLPDYQNWEVSQNRSGLKIGKETSDAQRTWKRSTFSATPGAATATTTG